MTTSKCFDCNASGINLRQISNNSSEKHFRNIFETIKKTLKKNGKSVSVIEICNPQIYRK